MNIPLFSPKIFSTIPLHCIIHTKKSRSPILKTTQKLADKLTLGSNNNFQEYSNYSFDTFTKPKKSLTHTLSCRH